MAIAVQVYSVREEAEKDFKGTMERFKEMGYDGVELAGLYGMTPEQVKEILDTVGLTAISAHVPMDSFMEDMDGTIQAYKTIGCSYVVIPWMDKELHFGGSRFPETVEFIKELSVKVRENGMVLAYHNHDFEFDKAETGSFLLDELYSTFDPSELSMELDTCWVKVAGVEPQAYLEQHKGRCPIVHIKDFKKGEQVELMALGEGEMDIPGVALAAKECGATWFVIEQDDHPYGDPMGNMEKSIQFLKKINL